MTRQSQPCSTLRTIPCCTVVGKFQDGRCSIGGSRSNHAESEGGIAEGGILCSFVHAGHVLSLGILFHTDRERERKREEREREREREKLGA